MISENTKMTKPFKSSSDKTKSYQTILKKISASPLKISNIEWVKKDNSELNGFMVFNVKLNNVGLSLTDCYEKYTTEIFSNHMINFIGELLIRTNLEVFLNSMFSDIEETNLLSLVSKESHVNFGCNIDYQVEELTFSFHVSFLQKLLTEDFKNRQ